MLGLEETLPLGKITVRKSLILPKITHLLLNLPDPDDNFLKELNTLLFNFLWGGKTDKIKRSGICANDMKWVD